MRHQALDVARVAAEIPRIRQCEQQVGRLIDQAHFQERLEHAGERHGPGHDHRLDPDLAHALGEIGAGLGRVHISQLVRLHALGRPVIDVDVGGADVDGREIGLQGRVLRRPDDVLQPGLVRGFQRHLAQGRVDHDVAGRANLADRLEVGVGIVVGRPVGVAGVIVADRRPRLAAGGGRLGDLVGRERHVRIDVARHVLVDANLDDHLLAEARHGGLELHGLDIPCGIRPPFTLLVAPDRDRVNSSAPESWTSMFCGTISNRAAPAGAALFGGFAACGPIWCFCPLS